MAPSLGVLTNVSVEQPLGQVRLRIAQGGPKKGFTTMIILGIVLLIAGLLLKISILTTIGIILLVIGVVLALLGSAGRAVGGRRHYF